MLNVVARVCELLLGRPPLEEESDRFTRMSGEVTSRSSNLRGPAAMNESDGQIAQRSHDLRGRASAQAGAIFSEGDITHIMQSIFDAPMPARQIEQTPRTGLDLGEVGDEVDHSPSSSCRSCTPSPCASSEPLDGPVARWEPDSCSCHS